MTVEHINPNDSLNTGRVKLNAAIDQSNEAITKATTADENASQAVTTANSVQEQFNQVVIEGDSSVEAAQARVSSTGTTYTTLKERLDQEHESVTSQLAHVVYFVNPSMTQEQINSILATRNRVRFQSGIYSIDVTKSILPKSNQIIEFDEGAVLQAKTNGLNGYEIVKIVDVENLTIINITIIGDRDTHTGTTGEHGHGIWIQNTKNLTLINAKVSNCWGDGIYHSSGFNTKIESPVLDNNRRNNLTVISADGLVIDNPIIKRANGVAPEAGIDCEPNFDTEILKNITINNPYFEDNNGNDFGVYLLNKKTSEDTINIVINNANSVSSTLRHAAMFNLNYIYPNIKGQIVFKNCFSDNRRFLSQSDVSSNVSVDITTPVIKDWADSNIGAMTIRNSVLDNEMKLGNISIDNPKFIINKYPSATVGIEVIDDRNLNIETDPVNIKSPIVTGVYANNIKILYSSYGSKFNNVNIDDATQSRKFIDYSYTQRYSINFGMQQKLKLPQDIILSNVGKIELLVECVTMNTSGASGEIALFTYSDGQWSITEIIPLGKTSSLIPHQLFLDADGFPAIKNKHANTNYTFLVRHTISGLYGVGKYSEFYRVNSGLLTQKAKAIADSWYGHSVYRPSNPLLGQQYYDTALGKPIWWSGSAWKDATGATV